MPEKERKEVKKKKKGMTRLGKFVLKQGGLGPYKPAYKGPPQKRGSL